MDFGRIFAMVPMWVLVDPGPRSRTFNPTLKPLSWGPHEVGSLVKCELTWGNAVHRGSFIICEKWKIGRKNGRYFAGPFFFWGKKYATLEWLSFAFSDFECNSLFSSSSCRELCLEYNNWKNLKIKMYILLCSSWIYWKKKTPIT